MCINISSSHFLHFFLFLHSFSNNAIIFKLFIFFLFDLSTLVYELYSVKKGIKVHLHISLFNFVFVNKGRGGTLYFPYDVQ